MRTWTLLVVALAGCQAPPSPVATVQTALGESLQAGAAIYVLDSGHYVGDYIYHGAHYDSVWVDLSIRNDAYDKRAGIVWTNDGWKTSQTAWAAYKGALPDGRERWGMDLKDAVVQAEWQPPGEVEYAAFVEMNGQTSWSPFRDHYIYDRVTPAAPLRLLSSTATTTGGVTVAGTARALNVPGARHVFVRYTIDGWQSWREVEAAPAGGDFAFTLPVDGDPAAVDEVAFALRLEANGEVAWDNAGGANYHVRLAPSLTTASWANATPTPSSGIKVLTAGAATALPVTAVTVRADDGSAVPLPAGASGPDAASGFSSGGSFVLVYDTSALADGTHAFTVEIAAGPFVRRFALPSLAVAGTVRALGGAVLGDGNEAPWDYLPVGDATYVHGDQHLFRVGADGSVRAFDPSSDGLRIGDFGVDGAGRVYALTNSGVARWNVDGTLDQRFGTGGLVKLDDSYAGAALCWAADLAADAQHFYVVDSCNTRLLRFGLDGSFVDALSLADGGFTGAGHTTWHDGTLFVARTFFDGALHTELAGVAVDGTLRVVATQPVSPALANGVDGFDFAADGVWATSGDNLFRLDAGGSVVAEWTGGGAITGAPTGSMEIARRVRAQPDGSVAVASTGSKRLERFALRPAAE